MEDPQDLLIPTKAESDAISELIYIENWIVQSRKIAATLPEQENRQISIFDIKASRSIQHFGLTSHMI